MDSPNISRRSFVQAAGALGALSVLGAGLPSPGSQAIAADAEFPELGTGKPLEAKVDVTTGEVTVNPDVIVRYSACLGCYSSCGNRVKMDRQTGSILTVGGNPYNPACAYPYLSFDTPLEKAYLSMSYANGEGNITRGTVCGRGQGTQIAYSQPDRITTPLKRAGKRGENKWTPISWDQLIQEVTEGGKLFADIGEDQEIEGFKAIHDTATPMDPEQPGLGPKSNQFVALGGRGDGRAVVAARFASCFGSLNNYGHGSSCGGAEYTSTSTFAANGGYSMRSDIENAEYILWMGTFPGATGKSFQGIAKRTMDALQSGRAKMDVVDPALGNGCVTPTAKNINWVPIRSATNDAFTAALVRWMIENDAFNAEYMAFPNYDAAYAGGYASYCNATHLIIDDEANANDRKYLRAEEAGLEAPVQTDSTGATVEQFVVIDAATGQPAAHSQTTTGELEFEGEVNGIKVCTAFVKMKRSVFAYTMDEYSEITNVPVSELERIANEFTSHGVKASTAGLGATAVANGVSAIVGQRLLNAMIGSDQMIGGNTPRRVSAKTTTDGTRYKLSTIAGKPSVSSKNAVQISRTGKAWKATDEYANRVASGESDPQPKLPWNGPVGSDNQALTSIVNQYPYQCKILVTWMSNTIEATPGAWRDEFVERLEDPSVLPLFIACDVSMGEMAQMADYFVPDTTPYESFGVITNEGYFSGKGNSVRWRVKTPETVKIDGDRYASYEAFICDVAKACDMPGFGDDAIQAADGTTWDFNDAPDFFLKAVANLAYDTTPVDDVSASDAELQALDELPESWSSAVTAEEWPKVLNVLSRGGRFWPVEESIGEGGRFAAAKPYEVFIYNEKFGTSSNGKGSALPPGTVGYTGEQFSDGSLITDHYSREEFPFASTNYKAKFRSVTMQANNPILRDLCAHNYLEINRDDAQELGISDGEQIRITNAGGDVMEGVAMVRGGIAKGTFAVAWSYGHRAFGTKDLDIDGEVTRGNPAIGAGVHLATMLDPTVEDGIYPFADNVGAEPARCGGMYKIEKA